MDALRFLEALTEDEARAAFGRCCGAARFTAAMTAGRPYRNNAELLVAAERQLRSLERADWLEAFGHHPRIGGREARGWAASEQAGAAAASDAVRDALAQGNRDYAARFGYTFIVCATGKSAEEMLALLHTRLANEPGPELEIAAAEQSKITLLRLRKLLEEVA